ncbi:MAG: L,D-transpeptidase [Acidobacteria bacterium]|nr:L,D-transpeptidase [Acidobacteriota bacterium]
MSGRRWAAGLAALATAALLALWAAGHLAPPAEPPADLTPLSDPERRELRSLEKQAGILEKKIRSLRPRGTYLIVDTGRNLMTLVENDRKTLTAVCSTGSGRALSDPEHRRMWVFDTPRGEFVIRAKYRNPVWIKPDWAFLEEGEPIPRTLAERMAPLELGAYAMDLGDGYLIHGTLYQRALGLSITHGCIRLGDRDLEKVFESVRIGTPVYIF